MEQDFNQTELEHLANIKNKRKAMFNQMGVAPTFSNEQTNYAANNSILASAPPSSRDRLAKIRQIQNGTLKKEMRHFNNADSPNNSFQEIPVKSPKRPVTKEQEQKRLEEINTLGLNKKTISSQGSAQMNAVESMFDADAGFYNNSDVVMGNAYNERKNNAMFNEEQQYGGGLVNENSMMGNIGSWEDTFRNKVGSPPKQQVYNQDPRQNNNYNPIQHQQNNDFSNPQSLIGPTQLNNLIESKATQIFETKIREILSEFSQDFNEKKPTIKQGQILAERVKSNDGKYYKNVIKMNGKYYKLEEIKE